MYRAYCTECEEEHAFAWGVKPETDVSEEAD